MQRTQWLPITLAAVRSVLSVAGMVTLYYLAPTDHPSGVGTNAA